MIYIKSDKEIELMRKPCAIVRDVLNLCQDKIKVGMTTRELDKIAHDYIVSCGATPSFLGYGGFRPRPVYRSTKWSFTAFRRTG